MIIENFNSICTSESPLPTRMSALHQIHSPLSPFPPLLAELHFSTATMLFHAAVAQQDAGEWARSKATLESVPMYTEEALRKYTPPLPSPPPSGDYALSRGGSAAGRSRVGAARRRWRLCSTSHLPHSPSSPPAHFFLLFRIPPSATSLNFFFCRCGEDTWMRTQLDDLAQRKLIHSCIAESVVMRNHADVLFASNTQQDEYLSIFIQEEGYHSSIFHFVSFPSQWIFRVY